MPPSSTPASITILLTTLLTLAAGCSSPPQPRSPMDALLLHPTPAMARVLHDPATHRLQLLVSPVTPNPSAQPALLRHGFRVDAEYFYPASSIKLCAAVAGLLTLQHLEQTHATGPLLDAPLEIEPLFPGDAPQSLDPGNLPITVRREIRKLALVSDNQAFNRLFDLVGHTDLNRIMHDLGLRSVALNHRLSDPRPIPNPLASAAVTFHPHNLPPIRIPQRTGSNRLANPGPGLSIGQAWLRNDATLVQEPMDFTHRNGISLVDLQNLLIAVLQPELLPPTSSPSPPETLTLTPAHRQLLRQAMTEFPRESIDPPYDPATFPDPSNKFLLPGVQRVFPDSHPASRIQITGKIGRAYGFSVENCRLHNPANGRSVFVTAVLYTNADGVLNDDRYEYETVADPFLADLGERIARLWLADQPWDGSGPGAAARSR